MVQGKAKHMHIAEDKNDHTVGWQLPTPFLQWSSFSVLHLIELSFIPLGESPL